MTRYLKSFKQNPTQSQRVASYWLIDWIVFYAILAIFQLHRKYQPYNIIPLYILYVICVHPQPLFIMQFKFLSDLKGYCSHFFNMIILTFFPLLFVTFYALSVIFQPYNGGFYYLKVKFWRFTCGTYDFFLMDFEPTL